MCGSNAFPMLFPGFSKALKNGFWRQQAAGSSREGKDAGGLGVLVCQARVGQRAKPERERVGPRQSMAWHGMA